MNALGTKNHCNSDCEKALLGAVVLDSRQWLIVGEMFPLPDPEEPFFYFRPHQIIFEAMMAVHARTSESDLTLIAEELYQREQLEEVGGAVYLSRLVDELYSLHQVPEYCRIVLEKWKHRKAQKAAKRIALEASSKGAGPSEVISLLESALADVNFSDDGSRFVSIGDSLEEELNDMAAIRQHQIERIGHKTGFDRLDEFVCGLRPGNMVVLAARPSVGKTALALNLAANLAFRQNIPVGFQSLEMGRKAELNARVFAQECKLDLGRVMQPRMLSGPEWNAVKSMKLFIEDKPLFIDDSAGLKVGEVKRRARALKRQHPALAVFMVDYLQLMHGDSKRYETREREVSEISGAMKALAKDLSITVVALCQLSRANEKRKGIEAAPVLSDLRDSGSIEQDADAVIMIDRAQVDTKSADKEAARERADRRRFVFVRKNRNGPCGEFKIGYEPSQTRFYEVAG